MITYRGVTVQITDIRSRLTTCQPNKGQVICNNIVILHLKKNCCVSTLFPPGSLQKEVATLSNWVNTTLGIQKSSCAQDLTHMVYLYLWFWHTRNAGFLCFMHLLNKEVTVQSKFRHFGLQGFCVFSELWKLNKRKVEFTVSSARQIQNIWS